MKRLWVAAVLSVSIVMGLAASASATTTWNLFNGVSGDGTLLTPQPVLFSQSSGDPGVLAASAFARNTYHPDDILCLFITCSNAGDQLPIYQNNQGLGIKGGGLGACADFGIDQCAPAEFLRLSFANTSWDPVSVTMASLGGGDNWEIYGENGNNDFLNGGATLLATGNATSILTCPVFTCSSSIPGSGLLTINFLGDHKFQNLYIMPPVEPDCSTTLNCAPGENDAFRVYQVVGEIPTAAVPEPGTLLLLGAGLAGLSGFARQRPR